MAKISILISAYNAEEYFEECMESVLNQTSCVNIEIVIVNNASTDHTKELVDKYASEVSFIKPIHLESNVGLFMSRHIAINTASGDYCVFLDSDDLLAPNAVETIYKDIEENNSPDVILYRYTVFGDVKKRQISVNLLGCNRCVLCNDIERNKILYTFCATDSINNIWIKAVKRKKALEFSNYENYSQIKYAEDKLNSIFFLKNSSIAYEPAPLYFYRQRGDSISKTFQLDRFFQNQILNKVLFSELVNNSNFSKIQIKDIVRYNKNTNMHLLALCCSKKQFKSAQNIKKLNSISDDLYRSGIFKNVKCGILWDKVHNAFISKNYNFIIALNKMLSIYSKIKYRLSGAKHNDK